jgi:hypothetical protein
MHKETNVCCNSYYIFVSAWDGMHFIRAMSLLNELLVEKIFLNPRNKQLEVGGEV